jgi:hypothetical protein
VQTQTCDLSPLFLWTIVANHTTSLSWNRPAVLHLISSTACINW